MSVQGNQSTYTLHTTVQLDDEFLFTKYCFGASRSNLHDATIAAVFTGSERKTFFVVRGTNLFGAVCKFAYLLTYLHVTIFVSPRRLLMTALLVKGVVTTFTFICLSANIHATVKWTGFINYTKMEAYYHNIGLYLCM